jgi:AcrR family transcriptional regulator
VYDALLDAAEHCLQRNTASFITVRQIAQVAGVNQAMINYYFGDKDGLFVSLFENDVFELTRKLNVFLKAIETDEERLYTIEALMKLIEVHFCTRKSMTVMCQDVVDEGSTLNQTYNLRLAARGYSGIVRVIAALMDKGRCRTDITPEHAGYLVCSVCALPFLLAPIFNVAFNTKTDGEERESRRRAMARVLEVGPADGSRVP